MAARRRTKRGYRVYKPTYKDRHTGESREGASWAVEFQDHTDRPRPRRLTAFTDKGASEDLGRKLMQLVALRAAGESPNLELTRWMETTPARIRTQLVAWGLVDAHRATGSKTLKDHLADFKQAILADGKTEKHATMTATRAERVFDGCGFTFWSEVEASRVQTHLADLRKGSDDKAGISIQTSNYYLQAVKGFCRWMVKERRATQNPLAHLRRLNADTGRTFERRALSVDELSKLMTKTQSEPERYGMTGDERAMLYRLAAETGLRAGELRSLTRASFNLTADVPTVAVEAAYSKRKRRDTLPLRQDTADVLRRVLATKAPAAPAFNMPDSTMTAAMIREDMEAAKVKPTDDAGRVADFHALRHTFITNLGRTGIHFKTQQELARHSTPVLTARYSHSLKHDEVAAVNALPTWKQHAGDDARSATGTDDATVDTDLLGAQLGANRRTAMAQLDDNGQQIGHKWPRRDSNPDGPCGPADFKSDGGDRPESPEAARNNAVTSDDTGDDMGCLARSLAQTALNHPDLAEVADAWPSLPPAVRAGIMAMVRASSPGTDT